MKNWRRVTANSLPKSGRVVLAYRAGQYFLASVQRNAKEQLKWYPGGYDLKKFDFWMPLPPEPTKGAKE